MSYYDYKALVVQHRSSTHLGEVEKDWFKFDLWGKPFVTEELKYQNGATARWGGDISQQFWKDNRNSTYDSYAFTYDVIGRMLNATYTDHASTSVKFSENVTYDSSGNILSLERYGRTGSSSYGKIDNLAYTYSGNKLSSVNDIGFAAYSTDFRYSNGTNNTYNYTYYSSGRMTADASKGITSITWNILSQPQTVTFSDGSTISYKYAADGTKLQEAKTVSGNTTTTDYTGTLVLENGTNSRLSFGNGYVSLTDNAYHYFITDHLGSVRVVASATGTAEEYNHYYPLGGLLPSSSSNTGIQPIKFQGKEWCTGNGVDLNLYDFGARRYDPSIGRWLSQDPLAEKYYYHTPYLFCAANPLTIIDPDGETIIVRDKETEDQHEYEWKKQSENWGFYDKSGNIYVGNNNYIISLSKALSTLMQEKNGNALVSYLVKREENVVITTHPSLKNFYHQQSMSVSWNPDNSLLGYPFISLAHELAHAQDHLKGTLNNGVWIHKEAYEIEEDVPLNEIYSTHIENLIRKEHSLPLRKGYLMGLSGSFIGPRIIDLKNRSLFYDKEGNTFFNKVKPNNRYVY